MDVTEASSETNLGRLKQAEEFGTELSLVLPAWNEEETILQAIQEAETALQSLVSNYEVIVVDDGSTDRTAEIVRAQSELNPRVRLVQQPRNIGYGAALKAGFRSAKYKLVAFTDADCQFNLANLEYMLPLAKHYDIVSGYRIDRKDPLLRRFLSWGYNTLTQFLIGSRIRDVDCALKIFHRDKLDSILPEADNFFANTEMFSKAENQGLSVVDVGVQHRPRAAGESKVSFWDVPQTLKTLLPFWWTRVLFSGEPQVATNSNKHFWGAFALLMLVTGMLLFPNLSYPLIEPDEGRYAEIPREMLTSGDWITPKLHNEPYLDKPPMFYWLCATSFRVFGPTDWAARLVPAMAAFLTVLVTFLFGNRILGLKSAFLGSLAMVLSLGFVCLGRFLIIDSLLTFFVALSLFTAYESIMGEKLKWSWWILSAVASGLGMLTKGPVAFLLLIPPLLAYCWISKTKATPSLKAWGVYVLVALGVAAPWYIAIIAREPRFAHYFFWENNFGRFLYSQHHSQPFWFYLPAFIVIWVPWGLLLPPLILFLVSRSASLRNARPLSLGFLILWAGWCLFFFSLSKGKLAPYILPAIPPIALAFGHFLSTMDNLTEKSPLKRTSQILCEKSIYTVCIAGFIGCIVAYALQLKSPFDLCLAAGFWSVAFAFVIFFRKKNSLRVSYVLFGLLAFVLTFDSSSHILPAWGENYAAVRLPPHVKDQIIHSNTPVISCGQDWGSVPFYLQRDKTQNVNAQSLDQLKQHVDSQTGAYLILDHNITLESVRENLPPTIAIDLLSNTRKATVVFLHFSKEKKTARRQSVGWVTH